MIDLHLRKMRRRDDVDTKEEAALRAAVTGTRDLPADTILVRRGEELSSSTILISGWMARSKQMNDGQRQMSEIHVPGDFVDLHSFTLKRLDHDVSTLTPCRIAIVPHEKLREISERFPHLTRVLWFSTNLDAAIYREWTVSLGRRSAIERMAHLFCELLIRLEIVGLTNGNSYDFPLTQHELSECLGMTPVHINRTLQDLRRTGIVEVGSRRVTIHDFGKLAELAEFDDSYLHLERKQL